MKCLNRLLLATLMSILYCGTLLSQFSIEETIPDSASIEAQVEYILAPLDMSSVSSDILMDRTILPSFFPDLLQSVEVDSLYIDYNKFDMMHISLYSGLIPGSSVIENPETAYRNHYDSYTAGTAIPIYLSVADYHRFDSSAIENGSLDSINGQLVHPPGVSIDAPYLSNRIYGSTLFTQLSEDTEVSFIIKEEYLLGNIEIDVSTIEVDADDGNGYRPISLDVELDVFYPEDVEKSIKLRYSDINGNVTVHFHKIKIGNNPPGEPVVEYRGEPITFSCDVADTCFTWPMTDPGDPFSPVQVNVKLACGDDLTSLKKPLFILDGIELVWDQNLSNENS